MVQHKEASKTRQAPKKYNKQFKVIFDAIRDLMAPPAGPVRRIGFQRAGAK
jgi:hypothetical protein